MSEALIKDILEYTKDGEWGKGEPGPGLVKMGVIRGTDFEKVRQGDLSTIPVRYIPEKIAKRKQLQAGDILFETAGGTKDQPTGRSLLLHARLFSEYDLPLTCASFSRFLRPNQTLIDQGYLYWFLQYLWNERLIYKYHIQHTGVARFQYTDFAGEQYVPLLPRAEQLKIAEILGLLDDKIELNRKTAATLEEMARALYRSWFVDFDPVQAKLEGRRPAHMDAAAAALFPEGFGADGLPKGWHSTRIGDVITLNYGKALTKEQREPGRFPVYGSGGSNSTHREALVNGPTIIVGRKGTVGSVYWEPRGCWPIDTVFFVTSKLPLSYVLATLRELPLDQMNTDAAVPGLNRENVYRLEIAMPPTTIVDEFHKHAGTWQAKIDLLASENRALSQMRDLLLPKLMSGELRIGDAKELVEDVA